MTTDLATAVPGSLALRPDQQQWTEQQHAALAQIGIDKAPAGDQQVFLHVCQRTGLDPFSRQIYMIARGGKWTIQTGIDGFRVIAERRPEYAGQTPPQWCGRDGVFVDVWLDEKHPPVAARVGVLRHDRAAPSWGVVLYAEFSIGNEMWRTKAAHMIAKVAEATALRKAFPNDFAGLVAAEEADHRPVGDRPQSNPVTVHELTGGTRVPARADPDDRMRPEQQRKIFALLREADVDDRMAWASGILGREITSYGQLGVADASVLIDRLENRAGEPA